MYIVYCSFKFKLSSKSNVPHLLWQNLKNMRHRSVTKLAYSPSWPDG